MENSFSHEALSAQPIPNLYSLNHLGAPDLSKQFSSQPNLFDVSQINVPAISLAGTSLTPIENSFLSEKVCRDRAELALLISRQSKYPTPPSIMRKSWESLVPAILELSEHQRDDDLTLMQSVKKTKTIKGSGKGSVDPSIYSAKAEVLDYWLFDVLVLVGTLPIESSEVGERFVSAGAERLNAIKASEEEGALTTLQRQAAEDGDLTEDESDGGISAQSRNEAMLCLELLCARVWYARHREGRTDIQIRAMLFSCLQFLYWETGVPTSLTMLLDEAPSFTDEVFDDVRKFNFRQLYAIEDACLLPNLFRRISHGVTALSERRVAFSPRFAKWLRKDVRWARSFVDHCEIITEKYNTLGE